VLGIVSDGTQHALNGLEEPEVAHVIGFIEHHNLNLGEIDVALLDEVFQTARSCNNDVNTTTKCRDLTPLRHSTVDLSREESDGAGDGLHSSVNLQSQFARGGQDERAGSATHLAVLAAVVLHESLDEGCAKGNRLSRARTTTTEYVATGQDVGDGRRLNRERCGCPELIKCAADVSAESEVAEAHALNLGRKCCLCFESLKHNIVFRREARLLRLVGIERRSTTFATFGSTVIAVITRTLGARTTIVACWASRTVIAVITRTLSTFRAVIPLEARTFRATRTVVSVARR
jgi:hypothetical protein